MMEVLNNTYDCFEYAADHWFPDPTQYTDYNANTWPDDFLAMSSCEYVPLHCLPASIDTQHSSSAAPMHQLPYADHRMTVQPIGAGVMTSSAGATRDVKSKLSPADNYVIDQVLDLECDIYSRNMTVYFENSLNYTAGDSSPQHHVFPFYSADQFIPSRESTSSNFSRQHSGYSSGAESSSDNSNDVSAFGLIHQASPGVGSIPTTVYGLFNDDGDTDGEVPDQASAADCHLEDIPSPPPDTKLKVKQKRNRRRQLWAFLQETLGDTRYSPSIIEWVQRETGVFRFVEPRRVAELWGLKRRRSGMTYEHLSRAMRYYYRSGVMQRVADHGRLVYQFLTPATVK